EKAKEKQENKSSKLSFLGTKVVREYSEKEPSYSKTLDLWEIHKGLDISADKGYEVKSLLDGKVVNVFKDDKHGISVRVEGANNVVVVYSNLDEKTNVKKGQEVTEGQVLGTVGNTTSVESEDGTHVHVEAFKGEESIDPMTLLK
ncbi:MAG: peptidoglycan DD-metalloendopeptidase family protein, partial [Romboutsia timonensis]